MRLGNQARVGLVAATAMLSHCPATAEILAHGLLPLASVIEQSTAPDGAVANAPIALAADVNATKTAAEATPSPASEVGDAAATSERSQSPVREVASRAVNESRALGQPNELFSARPEANGGTNHAETGSTTAGFDLGRSGIVRVIGATGIVVIVAWLAARLVRRFAGPLAGARRPSGVVEILARFPVARGQQLVLLKLGRRILLLHQSGTAMTTLSELVDENEVAAMLARIESGSSDGLAPRFQSLLNRFNADHRAIEEREQSAAIPSVRAALLDGEHAEIVDLTRRNRRGLLGRSQTTEMRP